MSCNWQSLKSRLINELNCNECCSPKSVIFVSFSCHFSTSTSCCVYERRPYAIAEILNKQPRIYLFLIIFPAATLPFFCSAALLHTLAACYTHTHTHTHTEKTRINVAFVTQIHVFDLHLPTTSGGTWFNFSSLGINWNSRWRTSAIEITTGRLIRKLIF